MRRAEYYLAVGLAILTLGAPALAQVVGEGGMTRNAGNAVLPTAPNNLLANPIGANISTSGTLATTNTTASTSPTTGALTVAGGFGVSGAIHGAASLVVKGTDPWIDVTAYGAVGDDLTDNSTAFTNALAAVPAGGATVYIPPGTYRTSTALTLASNTALAGAGWGASIIKTTSATADVINTAASATLIEIRDLSLNSTVAKTAGAGIKSNSAGYITITNVYMTAQFIGIDLESTTIAFLTNLNIRNTVAATGTGILINGGNDQYLTNIVADNPAGAQPLAGIDITSSGATWIFDSDIIHSGTGLLINPPNLSTISWLFAMNSSFDSNSGNGININPATGGTAKGLTFTGTWSSSNTLNGFNVGTTGTVDGVRIIGHRAFANTQHGILVAGGINVAIDGADVSGNSVGSAGTYHGIAIGANVSQFSIRNSRSGQMAALGNTQGYGILLNAGTGDNYIIANNDLRTNVTGGLTDIATSVNKQVIGNLGTTAIANTLVGQVKMTDATASTSTTTGAATITGGLGVGGALNASSIAMFNGASFSTLNGSDVALGIGGDFMAATSNNGAIAYEFNVYYKSGWQYYNTGPAFALRSDGASILQLLSAASGTGGTAVASFPSLWTATAGGGLQIGGPTGGDKGAGTLNLAAGGIYDNGTAPTGTGAYVHSNSPTLTSPTISGTVGAAGPGTLTQASTGAALTVTSPVTAQSQPTNPTGTASTIGVMMGLAGSITPAITGKIMLVISGDVSNNTLADGAKIQASYGTGTAPTNGAAITGTQCGARPFYTAAVAGDGVFFSVNCVVTGLTVGTAYWLDTTLAAITGGTATMADVSISAYEIR